MNTFKGTAPWVKMLLAFQAVERRIIPPGEEERRENDVEHSYHLAMTAWYLNETYGLGMDSGLLLKYALVHDLPEVYAGDPCPLDADAAKLKPQREAEALARLRREFPGAEGIFLSLDEYEHFHDEEEAAFVYTLDKVMPRLLVAMGGVATQVRDGVVKLSEYDTTNLPKLERHPFVKELHRQASEAAYTRLGIPLPEWITETGEEA